MYVCVCTCVRVCLCVCTNECVMGLFDWWGCYCQSIHHSSSPASPLSLLPHSLTPSSLWWWYTRLRCSFLSPSWLSMLSIYHFHPRLHPHLAHCTCLFLVFSLLSSLVPVWAKLRVQDGQWVQNGGVWSWEPNGGWNRGEFLHIRAQTHFSLKHPYTAVGFHQQGLLFKPD